MKPPRGALWLPVLLVFAFPACGDDDDDGSEAHRRGVGAACDNNDDCAEKGQRCLPFKGGYCGIADCTTDDECPAGSACVAHDDGANYCFLLCREKPDCNVHRPLDDESNCASNVSYVDGPQSLRACVPPSG